MNRKKREFPKEHSHDLGLEHNSKINGSEGIKTPPAPTSVGDKSQFPKKKFGKKKRK